MYNRTGPEALTQNDDTPAFNYEEMVEDALRGVLRRALSITAEQGLPGPHHFYITFATAADGVMIPDYLREQHPDTMTIVLQHQYDDLMVTEDAFSVTLSFRGKPEALTIPFAAVTAFADPHAKFGLQFHVGLEDDEDEDLADLEDFTDEDAGVLLHDPSADERRSTSGKAEKTGEAGDTEGEDKGGDNVVTLDAFRKK